MTTERRGQRPMILSRATFSGSGSFGGHWFEEEKCNWEGLRKTIVKAVKFSMLGMPLVRATLVVAIMGISVFRTNAVHNW